MARVSCNCVRYGIPSPRVIGRVIIYETKKKIVGADVNMATFFDARANLIMSLQRVYKTTFRAMYYLPTVTKRQHLVLISQGGLVHILLNRVGSGDDTKCTAAVCHWERT